MRSHPLGPVRHLNPPVCGRALEVSETQAVHVPQALPVVGDMTQEHHPKKRQTNADGCLRGRLIVVGRFFGWFYLLRVPKWAN